MYLSRIIKRKECPTSDAFDLHLAADSNSVGKFIMAVRAFQPQKEGVLCSDPYPGERGRQESRLVGELCTVTCIFTVEGAFCTPMMAHGHAGARARLNVFVRARSSQ